jgi:hypothetical protein
MPSADDVRQNISPLATFSDGGVPTLMVSRRREPEISLQEDDNGNGKLGKFDPLRF